MKPVIGVVGSTDKNEFNMPITALSLAYTHALEKAGALPIILPFTENRDLVLSYVERVHGLLFPGGIDMDPEFYGEPPVRELGEMDRRLDLFQLSFFEATKVHNKPILGICRGSQLIHVALGGSLYQDIASQFEPQTTIVHMEKDRDTDHPVNIYPGSRLHALFGSRIEVNSRHHQCIKTPGKDLVITARAPDGVIEAAEHKNLPIDLVQWHPERMLLKSDAMLPLFKAFVKRCSL
jgi:putative glutamine amidotransferase